jgi:phosphoserine phosphatase
VSQLVAQFAIADVLSLTLKQLFAPLALGHPLSIALTFDQQQLRLNQQLPSTQTEPSLELVMFADTQVQLLLELVQQAELSQLTLVASNQRQAWHSYRFSLTCENTAQARTRIAELALAHNIEAALLADAPTLAQPGLLVMDMDSTTISIECIDEIAKLAGVGEAVAEVTERAMLGELDFAASLHQRVATLANAEQAILTKVIEQMPLMAGLEPLMAELKQHGWRIAIASGGFTYFAEHLQQRLGFDQIAANQLEIIDGKLTGKVLGAVVDAQAKADCIQTFAQQYQISPQQTVAMGDGANDLLMMAAAQLGVAFHAKPIVLQQADSAINFHGLDLMLHWLR